MAKKTLMDRLAFVAPPPSLVAPGSIVESVPDLQRILDLPRRPPVNCDIDPRTGRYAPATQALIEVQTEKFSRGPRISCACRPRKFILDADGQTLTIYRILPPPPEGEPPAPPEPPVRTTLQAFLADNQTMGDLYLTRGVAEMKPGSELVLRAADGEVGHPCITTLNPPQAWFLREAAQIGGAIGHMSVGSGKSLCFLLSALLFPDSRLAVLLIEAKQRQHYRSQYMRLREHFRVSSVVCDVDVPGGVVPGTVPLHIISYSILSRTENSDKLDRLEPDVLILDECFPARTKVLTDRGWLTIGEIVEHKLEVCALTRSMIGYLEWRPIVRWLRRPKPQKLVRVTHEFGSFVCTSNHKIWVGNEYVVAEALTCEHQLQTVQQEVHDAEKKTENTSGEKDGCFLLGKLPCDVPHVAAVAKEETRAVVEKVFCRSAVESEMARSEQEALDRICSLQDATTKELRDLRERVFGGYSGEKNSKVLFSELFFQSTAEQTAKKKTVTFAEMQVLQEKVFETFGRKEVWSRDLLFPGVRGSLSRKGQENSDSEYREEKPIFLDKDENEQSDERSCECRKDAPENEGAHFSGARRQRQIDDSAEETRKSSWFRLEDRISDRDSGSVREISVAPELLQSGHRQSAYQDRDRGRRPVTQTEKVAFSRLSQDRNTRSSRVVRVEILEPGSDGRFEECLGEDQAVYDLEVEGNHNYFADGVLVSNCHRAVGTSAINRRTKRYALACIKKREVAIERGERVRDRALRLLCGSGTMEVKSINDTQMLCAYALGTGSPLPLDPNEAEAWSNVIDLSYQPDRKSPTARALHRAFGNGFVEEDASIPALMLTPPEKPLREGFQKWRTETAGIISASASNINASIYIGEFELPKMPEVVAEALTKVRAYMRPDGEELVEKMEMITCARNVAVGFFPYWAFPKHPCTCPPNRTVTRSPNWCDQCVLIDEWYARRKKWNKEVRSKLLRGVVHLDSPALCEEAAERARVLKETQPELAALVQDVEVFCFHCVQAKHVIPWPCEDKKHLPVWNVDAWAPWREIDPQVEYEKKVRWIGHDLSEAKDPATHPGYFAARAAAKWALKNKGVVWFLSTPLGRKIAELSGLPYFNGGPGGEERLRAEAARGNRSIICSIEAHGAGTDMLQYAYNEQIIIEPPASNATAYGYEQIFGRLHRQGQPKDEVNTLIAAHVYEFKDSLRKAKLEAEWNFSMKGVKQKLLLADWFIEGL